MEKFLKKMQEDIDNKIMTAMKGESIVKPFSQVYEEVREKRKKEKPAVENNSKTKIYNEEQESLYSAVIRNFLNEHPELLEK